MSEDKQDKCPLCGQEMNDKAKAKKVKIENLKDLYNKYYEGKEYHLKRFWENSIFVWTFLMVCFTAYGLLMNKFLDKDIHCEVKPYFPIISSFICTIGIILSILWYKMTKASKAWFEVYENVIWELESLNNEFGYDSKYLIHNYWNTKDGERISSPSKIVIAIGALLIGFWIIALCFGICVSAKIFEDKTMTILSLCGLTLLCLFGYIGAIDIKSSTIRDKDSEKTFCEIKKLLNANNITYKYLDVKNSIGTDKPKIWLVLKESDNKQYVSKLLTDYEQYYSVDIK